MGWSSGSSLFSEIISVIKDNVIDDLIRKEIYTSLIPAFEEEDCDTLEECLGEDDAFDDAYHDYYPEIEDNSEYDDE